MVPVVVLLAAFGLRLVRLGEQNVWWDEALAFWAVRLSLPDTTLWTAADVHPPVFFWLLWAQTRLAGESEFVGRLVDVWAGVLTVALAIPAGRLLGRWRVGIVGALLLALARFPVWWSQELRMYAPATAFALAACIFALRAAAGRRWWFGYVISATLALWTLYLSAAVLLAANLFVALAIVRALVRRRGAWRLLLGWASAQIVVALLFGVWLALAGGRMRSWSTAEPVDPAIFVKLYATVLTTGISVDIDRVWPGVAAVLGALALGAAVGLLIRRPRSGFGWLLPVLVALIVPAAVFSATLPRALFYSPRLEVRYFLLAAPAAALLLAGALVAIDRIWRPLGVLATAATALAAGWFTFDYLDARHHRDEFDSIVAALRAYARPEDAVVLVSGDRAVLFSYAARTGAFPLTDPYGLPFTVPASAESAAGDIGPIAERHRRVWLVLAEAHLQDPGGEVARWLEANRPKVYDQPNGYNRLALFDRAAEPPAVQNVMPQHALDVAAGGSRRLLGYDLPSQRLFPGESGQVALWWRSGGTDAGPLALRLIDEAGVPLEEWIVDDSAYPPSQIVRRQFQVTAHRYTPAGSYRLEVESLSGRISLADLRIERTAPAPGFPGGGTAPRPVGDLGETMRLAGYELTSNGRPLAPGANVRPGDPIELALYWQPLARPDRSWVVFAHLLGSQINPANDTPLWGQADGYPLGGEFPTHQWRPGSTVEDRRRFVVDPATPAGPYEIEVGMYFPPTGERLPTADGAGRLILQNLMVER
ncbi:MAG: glycosyltransferase family 39 protein [Dehalococcoidia bacterium]